MAQRQLYHQSPPSMGGNEAGNLECTARPVGGSSGWRVPSETPQLLCRPLFLPGCWPGLTLCKSCLRVSLSSLTCVHPGKEALESLVSFRDLLKLFGTVYLPA